MPDQCDSQSAITLIRLVSATDVIGRQQGLFSACSAYGLLCNARKTATCSAVFRRGVWQASSAGDYNGPPGTLIPCKPAHFTVFPPKQHPSEKSQSAAVKRAGVFAYFVTAFYIEDAVTAEHGIALI
jgi:hypothetical protein